MTLQDWEQNDDAQKRYREDCGIFTEWPAPSDIVADRRDSQATGDRLRKASKNKPKAQ